MRVVIRNEDQSETHLLLVRDSTGLVCEVPPGKSRSVPLRAGLTVEQGRPFPGWDQWLAEQPGATLEVRMPWLLSERAAARARGDFARADEIRAEFRARGYDIEDRNGEQRLVQPMAALAGRS